ncbi:hypothetical protein BC936DRAFT_140913, partial [Jimgerdemannia flammicorona]
RWWAHIFLSWTRLAPSTVLSLPVSLFLTLRHPPIAMGNEISKVFKERLRRQARESRNQDSATTAATLSTSERNSNFRWDDGRRYHAVPDSLYCLPNDDQEIDRLHSQHWMLKHAFKGYVGIALARKEKKACLSLCFSTSCRA